MKFTFFNQIKNNTVINYEPSVDGLRAIAVLSVIFFHFQIKFLGFNLFTGGFLGVDIFFVISGYLIASIIIHQINQNKFYFSEFYERRARRILPALLFVLGSTSVLGYFYLLPNEFVNYAKSLLSSIFYYSNYFFYSYENEYFATNSILLPNLHTWSLAVEEQFYILFPIVYVFISKYYKKNITLIIVAILFLSLQVSDLQSVYSQSLNFYSFHTRAWELLAGVVLAKIVIDFGRIQNKLLNQVMPIVGLFLIFHSIFFFKETDRLPSFITLIPVFGTTLLIYFNNSENLVNKILSSKVFVSVGLISYSMYLWHFPILSFTRIVLENNISMSIKLMIFILIIILSLFSFKYIEQPFRNKKIMNFKKFILSLSISIFLISIYSLTIISKEGIQDRLPSLFKSDYVEPWHITKDNFNKICYDRKKDYCHFNKNSQKKIFLTGDSQLASYQEELKEQIILNDMALILMNNSACMYLPKFNLKSVFSGETLDKCNSIIQSNRKSEILKYPGSVVIVGGMMPLYLEEEFFDNKEGGNTSIFRSKLTLNGKTNYFAKEGFESLSSNERPNVISNSFKQEMLLLANKGYKIILQYPIPEVGWHPKNKMLSYFYKPYILVDNDDISNKEITTSYLSYLNRTEKTFKLYDSIVHSNIFRIYPHELFCNNKNNSRCITHNQEEFFYYDEVHTIGKGNKLIVDQIIKKLKSINF